MRTEDGYIINKCLNGEKAAFGFLVDKYKESVYAFAWDMLHNFHDAEDVTQEVFIKAYRNLHTLRRWDNFLVWLRSITYNLCKDLIRERDKRPERESIEERDREPLNVSSSQYREKEEQMSESLHEALDSLPEIYREVLTLHYFGGMKCKEIAQFLSKPASTIRQHLSRARAKLKKEMIDNMNATFEQQKLQSGFTFRIVEMVKRIKIRPTSSAPWFPLSLSGVTGVVLTVLMFTAYPILSTSFGIFSGSPLPSKTKVAEVGELPVDVLEISEITFLSSEQGDENKGGKELPKPPEVGTSGVKSNVSSTLSEKGKWTKKADIPFPVLGNNSACVVDGKIYACCSEALCEYNPSQDRWTKKVDIGAKENQIFCNAVNGKIYVIFESTYSKGVSTVKEYNPATDTWTTKADMPTPRADLTTCVVNGKIYAIGKSLLPLKKDSYSIVEEYEPRTDKWTRKSNMPKGMYAVSGSAIGEKVYVIASRLNGNGSSKVLEYNPMTDIWTEKTDIPKEMEGLSTCVLNGNIYAIGGYDKTNRDFRTLSTVVEYNLTENTWTQKAYMPTPRAYLSACVVNGKIYAIGGIISASDIEKKFTTIVEEFDPEF